MFWRLLGHSQHYFVQRSQLAENVEIGSGCLVTDSALGAGCKIGARATVADSTFADHVAVGEGSHVWCSNLAGWTALQASVQIGNANLDSFSYVARGAIIFVSSIGRFCSIGPNVMCGFGEHPSRWISTSPAMYSPNRQCGISFCEHGSGFDETPAVRIGHDVWIGANAVIRNGVSIGHGAIVAAAACVTKDVPPYSIVGGVPAQQIRMRFDAAVIAELLHIRWWSFPTALLQSNSWRWHTESPSEFLAWARDIRSSLEP